jgi:hypothetical protein
MKTGKKGFLYPKNNILSSFTCVVHEFNAHNVRYKHLKKTLIEADKSPALSLIRIIQVY